MPRSTKLNLPFMAGAAAFGFSVIAARLTSIWAPRFHWEPQPGLHIHHYVYGIFLLAVAGYLALWFKSPRVTPWLALMYGVGVGLTFDEFGMWLNPGLTRGARWNTSGLTIVIIVVGLGALLPILIRQTIAVATRPAAQPAEPLLSKEGNS